MLDKVKSEQIKAEKIRRIIEAGIQSKKVNPESDLTPNSYKKVAGYIVALETKVQQMGGSLPPVGY